jgi:hypothetical protein
MLKKIMPFLFLALSLPVHATKRKVFPVAPKETVHIYGLPKELLKIRRQSSPGFIFDTNARNFVEVTMAGVTIEQPKNKTTIRFALTGHTRTVVVGNDTKVVIHDRYGKTYKVPPYKKPAPSISASQIDMLPVETPVESQPQQQAAAEEITPAVPTITVTQPSDPDLSQRSQERVSRRRSNRHLFADFRQKSAQRRASNYSLQRDLALVAALQKAQEEALSPAVDSQNVGGPTLSVTFPQPSSSPADLEDRVEIAPVQYQQPAASSVTFTPTPPQPKKDTSNCNAHCVVS